jgi:hypothetical protein
MPGIPRFIVLFLVLVLLSGCGKKIGDITVDPDPRAIPQRDVKVRVVDVSNNTPELYDVDVIGLLWNALNDSLYRRGLLWMEDSGAPTLTVEARVQKFKKGHAIMRGVLPYLGNVELVVECDVKQGDTLMGTVQSKQSISFADEVLTKEAWKRAFSAAGEDIVNQLSQRI